jgi:DNA-binding CsgD family transcriptional regulator
MPYMTEVVTAMFLPDAIEAMVAQGQFSDAEPLVSAFEGNGRRLDRPWMLAVGARCRAVLLAGQGDLDSARAAVGESMRHHERLPMPFERARTQLLLGQLQRRLREKNEAARSIREALGVFEQLGAALWAERARGELARVKVGPRHTTVLSPSELRVAELAATGMTNGDIATELFISRKTVEANLSRIYRKLGIRSRMELGQHFGRSKT